jgi:hypothetical protein
MSNAVTFIEATKHLTEALEEVNHLPGAGCDDDTDLLAASKAICDAKDALRRYAVAHKDYDLVGPATLAAFEEYLARIAAL